MARARFYYLVRTIERHLDDEEGEEGTVELFVSVNLFEDHLRELEAELRDESGGRSVWTLNLYDEEGVFFVDPTERTEDDIEDHHRGFERFVDLLSSPIGRRFRSVKFVDVRCAWFREEDIARLFSDVLPALLPTLETLRFTNCGIPQGVLKRFLEQVSAAAARRDTMSLTQLVIDDCYVAPEMCAPFMAEAIRGSVPIQVLVFAAARRMGRDTCQRIFRGLNHNKHLRRLEIGIERVFEDSVVLPTDPSSPLRHLRIDVDNWTKEGKATLARKLKTNTTLEVLHVVYRGARWIPHRPWVELLETYNFTLRELSEEPALGPISRAALGDEKIAACLRRNERIHRALAQLPNYHVAPTALVPHVLEMVSSLPTLLYRFLRRGDINALVGQDPLLPSAAAHKDGGGGSGTKKRKTRTV